MPHWCVSWRHFWHGPVHCVYSLSKFCAEYLKVYKFIYIFKKQQHIPVSFKCNWFYDKTQCEFLTQWHHIMYDKDFGSRWQIWSNQSNRFNMNGRKHGSCSASTKEWVFYLFCGIADVNDIPKRSVWTEPKGLVLQ